MTRTIRVRSTEEAEQHVRSLTVRVEQLEHAVRDYSQKFDTLETPFWKRWLFTLNGWPHHRLNADHAAPRPWHRWWRP